MEDLGYQGVDTVLSIPKNPEFGDYTTNLALQLAKSKSENGKQSPEKIAKEIIETLQVTGDSGQYLEKVEAIGGFINFFIKPDALMESLHKVCDYSVFVNPEIEVESEDKRKILIEYAHPNTHKAFHIGHVRTATLGESIARILGATGVKVFRANYQGDIGLHVAKALWGVQKLEAEGKSLLNLVEVKQKAEFLGKAYTLGARAYGKNEQAKKEIAEINKKLYLRDPEITPLWEQTRRWSLDYFDWIYQKLGIKFDKLFFESEMEKRGTEIVRQNLDKVFEEDQGAVIFRGDKHGLHNRVLLTSEGNPTYEAKELGLGEAEREAFPFDLAMHVVAVDQAGYMDVMFKVLEEIDEWFKGKEMHLSFGLVNLPSGKMASRTGNVVTFDWLYAEVRKKVEAVMKDSSRKISGEEKESIIDMVSIGAIKFTILKFTPSTNITFDLDKSVALSGDSGPYIQYTFARAKSVLRNAQYDYAVDLPHSDVHPRKVTGTLEKEERQILQKIEHFESLISEAAESLHPNMIATFLLELASLFNLFYQKHSILKAEEKSELRLALTCAVAVVLKQGLYLLGIDSPERM